MKKERGKRRKSPNRNAQNHNAQIDSPDFDKEKANPDNKDQSPASAKTDIKSPGSGTARQLISWLASYIDHTLLTPDATSADITRLCSEAAQHKFFAVCVNPCHVKQAVRELSSTPVVVATVVGFPLGADLTDIKIAQAQRALFEGAEELDMVINIGALKERSIDYVLAEIQAIVRAAREHPVKVIIECDLLTEEEKILASQLCARGGAAMVKTCTGFVKDGRGATIEDILLIKKTIDDIKDKYPHPVQIKASGSIKDYNQALALIEAGASRLGTSASVNIIKKAYDKDARNKAAKIKAGTTPPILSAVP